MKTDCVRGPSGEPELLGCPWTSAHLTGGPRSAFAPQCVSVDSRGTGLQGEVQAFLFPTLMRRSPVNNSDQWKIQKSNGEVLMRV